MKQLPALIIITLCLYFGISHAGEKVTARGVSFFDRGREPAAREKAMDEAKRAAIEKALSAVVDSKTVVENYTVISDRILSRPSGYLNSIDIVQERINDLGTYEVIIEAEVEVPDLVSDLERFQKMLGWQKNPRVSVIITPGLDNDYMPAANKAVGLITEKLKKNGFRVFIHSEDSDIQTGLHVGLGLGLSTKNTMFQDVEITVNEISLSAVIYRAVDNEILATASVVEKQPGENRLQALDDGSRLCVESIWNTLQKKLITLWESELYESRNIFLIVKGISSLAKAEKISSIFQTDVYGVTAVSLIRFRGNKAEYDLKFKGWPEHFLNEIGMSYFSKKYFASQLESINGNRLVIKIK